MRSRPRRNGAAEPYRETDLASVRHPPALVGGSEESHDKMTETAIKINEKLAAAGKQLENVSPEEFDDIAASVGLRKAKG